MRDVGMKRVGMFGGMLVVVLALAGCGGSSHSAHATSTTTSPTTAASGGPGGGFAALRTCLQSHGINLPPRPQRTPGSTRPRGTGGGGGFFGGGGGLQPPAGVSQRAFQSALSACRATLPNGGNRLNSSAFAAYRSCLADHGVKLPPSAGSAGTTPTTSSTPPPTINRNDPKTAAALKTCAPLLPQGFGRDRTTTTTTPA